MPAREPTLPAPRPERRLMSHPQPAGLLPTWWFWRELRDERPLLGACIGAFTGAIAALISWILVTTGVYLPAAVIVAVCAPMIGLGIVERALRWAVCRRRRRLGRVGAAGLLPEVVQRDGAVPRRPSDEPAEGGGDDVRRTGLKPTR